MTARTGYEIREGSQILADRRAEQERCQAVADAMIRRLRIKALAREALRLLDEGAGGVSITPQEIADGLLDARNLMNQGGRHWIKSRLRLTTTSNGKKEVCYCSIGAIQAARPGDKNRALREAMKKELAIGLPTLGYHGTAGARIITWNDHGDRRWDDVSRRFRQAAKRVLKRAA